MMTSNLAGLKLIVPPMAPVWIARGHPRGKGGWQAHLSPGVTGRADMRLAPSWAMLKATEDDYHAAFAAQLAAAPEQTPAPRRFSRRPTAHRQTWNAKTGKWEASK